MIDGTLVIMIYSIYPNYYFCSYKSAAIILNEKMGGLEMRYCLKWRSLGVGVVSVDGKEEFDGRTQVNCAAV